jgi:hypothetical protein
MKSSILKSLSLESQNRLSFGLFFLMICLGIRIAIGSDLALKVANTQLTIANSASKLSDLAEELDTQAEIIKQKDQAYYDLNRIYEHSLKEAEGYERLKAKIETIESLPEVQNIDQIQSEISDTEESFNDFTGQ